MKTLIATLALLCMIAAGTAEAGSKRGIASGTNRGSASAGHHGRSPLANSLGSTKMGRAEARLRSSVLW
jgi:hypothetical protein